MWHHAEGMVGKMSDTEGRNVEQPTAGRTEDDPAPDVQDLAEDVPPSQRVEETQSDEEITERIRRQGVKITRGTIAPTVFWPSLILIVLVAGITIFAPDFAGTVLNGTQGWIVENLGWFYMLLVGVFIVFTLVVSLTRYGTIILGREGEQPEFGLFSWFAMLFAAGMGIGLVFYGVGEPLIFATDDPKPGWPEGQSDRGLLAMAQTFVHWGLHPWAIYAVIGLALAYVIHRRGRPVSIRWAFEPLLGQRVKGWMGDVIDILAIFGTIFGIATSLGLGVQQIATGMQAIGIIDGFDSVFLVILVIVITLIATASVVSGLSVGIRWLSNINLSLAGILLISVLLLGPTLFIFQNMIESLGVYLANFLNMTLDVGAYTGEEGLAWSGSWTIFYWGWWISWAPFVGIFIARISRGRTVRQFITGVLLVPTIVSFLWFSVMGGTGLYRQFFGAGDLVDPEDGVIVEAALFDVLGDLPLGGIFSVIGILLVAIFFITSSDSGSLVIDMLASGGHPNPPVWSRVLFAVLEGVLAIALLLAGGLEALQAAALTTALPFSVVLLFMCFATLRSLRADLARHDQAVARARYARVSEQLAEDFDETFGEQVDSRVDERIDYRLSRTRGVFNRQAVKDDVRRDVRGKRGLRRDGDEKR